MTIHYRLAEGNPERFPELAAELVMLKVHVILTARGTLAAIAAKRATATIPIVFTAAGDPVERGLVANWRGRAVTSQGFLHPSRPYRQVPGVDQGSRAGGQSGRPLLETKCHAPTTPELW